jgi:2-polyprenyl-3-methyl-5-hydroxy-6-metoxy-1,4-benzoquinol methylase
MALVRTGRQKDFQELRQRWREHYTGVFAAGDEWLDASNDRVQDQTFGVCLEAADRVSGKRCLDLGCGWGGFSRVLAARGAQVTAVDSANVAREVHPGIEWREEDLLDDAVIDSLAEFERVFMIEVLQYLSRDRIASIWAHVAGGGRLVGVVPNGECPIVTRTVERFDGLYRLFVLSRAAATSASRSSNEPA